MNIKRDIVEQLIKDLDSQEIVILTGPRQVGKTTALHQVEKYLLSQNKISYFLNLEDPDYLKILNESPKNIFQIFPIDLTVKNYIFIDEIQYLDNPTNFLKYLFDEYKGKLKLIVSGSSAFYLDKKFKDSLAGRKKLRQIYSLDLREFLRFRNEENLSEKDLGKLSLSESAKLDRLYIEYVTWGGYPRVVLALSNEEKKEILRELVFSYIKKDIFEARIRHDEDVYRLLKILARQVGSLVNSSELANTLGVSKTAIDNYLYVLQKSFHIQLIRPFYKNLRKELTKMPKVFFTDLGIRNFLVNDFQTLFVRNDKGELLENAVFRQLVDRYGVDEIRFWRTTSKKEVDFVVESESLAYEVKTERKRVRRSKYKEFEESYPEIRLEFVSREQMLLPSS